MIEGYMAMLSVPAEGSYDLEDGKGFHWEIRNAERLWLGASRKDEEPNQEGLLVVCGRHWVQEEHSQIEETRAL